MQIETDVAGPGTSPLRRLIGREQELERLGEFLASVPCGPGAFVLAGEAGIGKSSAWLQGVSLARGEGLEVLDARPAEAEAGWAFAALGDLLEGVLGRVLPNLPAPQRGALEVAVLRSEPGGEPPEPRAIGAAFLGALRMLSRSAPVLCAVDDVQWLDRASAGVLEFAARRLRAERVAFLLSLRDGPVDGPLPLGLDRAFREERVVRVRLGSLSLAAIEQLLSSRLALRLSRAAARRVFEATGGNPFYALELGRALERRGAEPATHEPLPLPGGLGGLVTERLAALPGSGRHAVLIAAAMSQPAVPVIEEALGPARAKPGLRAALRAGVVELDGERVRFTHPLLAAAAYGQAAPAERRRVHVRLSELVVDIEEQARHLALAADKPEESVAATLERAAVTAAARGAPSVAAELAELAVALTPAELAGARRRRAVGASAFLLKAGDTSRAARELERLAEEMPAGEERAQALIALAGARLLEAGNRACVVVLERALPEAGSNVTLAARIHVELAANIDSDFREARRHLTAGLRLLRRLDEPALLAKALVEQMTNRCWLGSGLDRQLAERALELEQDHRPEWVHEGATMNLAVVLKHTDRLDEAREWFGEALRMTREQGDESTMPDLLAHLADLECWAGNWSLAERYATESAESFELTGQRAWVSASMYVRALVDAHLGRVEAARDTAERGLAIAAAANDPWGAIMLNAAAGFGQLSVGDLPEANAYLSQAAELADRIGLVEPCAWRFHANEIEAVIGLGELERAGSLLDRLRARGRKTNHPWAIATANRCQGLLAAARGEQPEAEAALTRSLVEHERLAMPFELARSLLVAGQIQRRGKHKRAAKDYLERALEIFESLPAPLWAERARAERARVGLRPPAPDKLSATEHSVASLAATGRTNREVAAALFMSPKTVEANLARVYRKLGISSRAELGAAMAHEHAEQSPAD